MQFDDLGQSSDFEDQFESLSSNQGNLAKFFATVSERRKLLPSRSELELKCDSKLQEILPSMGIEGRVDALILFDIRVGRKIAWLMNDSEREPRLSKILSRLDIACSDIKDILQECGAKMQRDEELDRYGYVRLSNLNAEAIYQLVKKDKVIGVLHTNL